MAVSWEVMKVLVNLSYENVAESSRGFVNLSSKIPPEHLKF
jgi:hypothetical protein